MNIVIIEDEKLTANDLANTIKEYDPAIEIVAKLHSVKDALRYFYEGVKPDLIFSDIELGDGLSFEVFQAVKLYVPVVFCTAYDEYALEAFKANGIDYLLKPFTFKTVSASLDKFYKITQASKTAEVDQLGNVMRLLEKREPEPPSTILVHYKDKILPIKLQEIAVFYLENQVVHLITFDRKVYFPDKSLEELEKITGKGFFRTNRQSLVNREAIVDVSHRLSRKLWVNLSVPIKEAVTISKEKSTSFLNWLAMGS
ncbi:LytTR family DNA-binding domain-containing protein [Flammeovirgaceae bacterium SG7u.111]|nr:LytTR family DNA-binding domain-containing protein [Flammeovirgaceae bacterium SG7u.132]WPO37266.1 LytTR family DNA-binding domain-containing protein [Flammeovirgaceae bacterium SG7u.111]